MSDLKLTPGPWRAELPSKVWQINAPLGPVALIVERKRRGAPGYDDEERDANARLIAAAPDLYDALEECLRMGGTADEEWMPASTIAKVRAALAKAKGEKL